MILTFAGFAGANRAVNPRLLPDGVGVRSVNQRPGRGDLRPWRAPANVAAVPAGRQSIYRMGRDVPADGTFWLSFTQPGVDAVRSLTADDPSERTFFSLGPGLAPVWTDNTIGLATQPYPTLTFKLGVPAPVTQPQVSFITTGTGATETKFFVWTWVNQRGEESAPSPVSAEVNAPAGSTLRVRIDDTIPVGYGPINRKRLYSTVAAGAATDFFFVAELPVNQTEFTDSDSVSRGEAIVSTTWDLPPVGLSGFKAMWNGMIAGFVGKSLRVCEPFRPFAWPLDYELVLDDTIVALGVWQQNLIALTTGQPYLITGTGPDALSAQRLEIDQACVSKRSVVEFGHGVAWASPDGLTYTGTGGTRVVTSALFLREDWQTLKPETMVAAQYEGAWVATFDAGQGREGIMLDPMEPGGCFFHTVPFTAAHRDTLTDSLYVLVGQDIRKWDGGPLPMVAEFGTNTRRMPRTMRFGFCQVIGDGFPVEVSIYGDGELIFTGNVDDDRAFRLPDMGRAQEFRVDVRSSSPVTAVRLAQSSAELRA